VTLLISQTVRDKEEDFGWNMPLLGTKLQFIGLVVWNIKICHVNGQNFKYLLQLFAFLFHTSQLTETTGSKLIPQSLHKGVSKSFRIGRLEGEL
jgi:hypothetical protein